MPQHSGIHLECKGRNAERFDIDSCVTEKNDNS